MAQSRDPSRAPWLAAAILGAAAILLGGLFVFVIHPAHDRNASAPKPVGLTAAEQQSVDAGAKQVVNILTHSRKSFAADYARTVSGAAGALRADLVKKQAALLAQMTKGKYDLQGSVTNSAFEEVSGNSSLILVLAAGYKLPDRGQRTLILTTRFELTMTKVDGKWLASDLQSIGLI
jgi:hypothetical protein